MDIKISFPLAFVPFRISYPFSSLRLFLSLLIPPPFSLSVPFPCHRCSNKHRPVLSPLLRQQSNHINRSPRAIILLPRLLSLSLPFRVVSALSRNLHHCLFLSSCIIFCTLFPFIIFGVLYVHLLSFQISTSTPTHDFSPYFLPFFPSSLPFVLSFALSPSFPPSLISFALPPSFSSLSVPSFHPLSLPPWTALPPPFLRPP